MVVYITKWFGRLGNNILQVRNTLYIACYYGYNLNLPKHKFFNKQSILINKKDTSEPIYSTSESAYFFSRNKIVDINTECFTTNHDVVANLLADLFVVDYKALSPLDPDDLVIHIRSGDLFIKETPHPAYIPPPLSYYTYILQTRKYKNIYLIAEDRLNPCINKLLELYPNIIFKEQSFIEDIRIILRAQTVVCSVGTMIPALSCMSRNIKDVFTTNYDFAVWHFSKDIHIKKVDCRQYKETMGKWLNKKWQHDIIMNY
jgi:hypothetical protein